MKKLLLLFWLLALSPLAAQPVINQQVSPYSICSDGPQGVYALGSKIPEILNGTDPSTVEVTFHLSQIDATNDLNPLPDPFVTNGTQMIFVRVELLTNPASFAVTDMLLVFNQGPPVGPIEYLVCGMSGTVTTVDLWSVAEQLWLNSGLNANEMSVNFYQTEADAYNNVNLLQSPYTMISQATQVIFASCMLYDSGCMTVIPVYLYVQDCSTGGQPVNIAACTDTDTACFDMTPNIANVLGSLDPAINLITFHVSYGDAETGSNPIDNIANYCVPVTMQSQMIFIRLHNIVNNTTFVHMFGLVPQTIVTSPMSFEPLVACDDDANGLVSYNFTTVAAQINTGNPLSYYLNSADATNGVNAIATPEAVSLAATLGEFGIFIRETVTGGCDIIYSVQAFALSNCNVSSECAGANTLCSTLNVAFPNTVNIPSSGQMGCLATTPNPTWFFIPVSQSGDLYFQISQTSNTMNLIDVDFICYGPFDNPTTACGSMLTPNYVVGCSYSAAPVETFSIPNAVAGKYYILMVTNFANQPGNITIELQGGSAQVDCTGMQFTAFLDANNNGSKDANEINFPMGSIDYVKNSDGTVHHVSAPTGSHTIYDINPANSYDVSYSVNAEYAANYTVSPAAYSDLSVMAGGGTSQYFFPVTATQFYNDLSVSIVPQGAPQPGFTYTNRIIVRNLSPQTVTNAAITFTHAAALTISSISVSGTVAIPQGFTYTLGTLAPFATIQIVVNMSVPVIPIVNLGDVVVNNATVTPLEGDLTPENNASVCTQTIIGSYDPNDKMESRGGRILIDDFTTSDYLYYTIRFENTGTAPAVNVRINDVLHPSLDPTSIRMIAASHPYVLDRVDNVLNWRFNNIMLPYSAQNPTGAQGFVHFKVKPQPGFEAGDVIPNTASIFFDFNPAIITNTFLTEFVDQLSTGEQNMGQFTVYPNPARTHINIASQRSRIESASLFDVTGKRIFTAKPGSENPSIDVSSVSSGLYLLEITDDSGQKAIRKIAIQ